RHRRSKLAEKVILFGTLGRSRAGPMPAADEASQPTHAAGGNAAVLAADQLRGGRHLSGDRDNRRGKPSALTIGPAAPVVEERQAGAPDRHLGLTEAPRSPEAVGDEDRRSHAGGSADLRPDPPRRAVGVLGKQ